MRTAGNLQKTASTIIAGLIVGLGTGGFAHAQSSAAGHSAETTTRIFTMDEVYKSMFGPVQNDRLVLLRTQTPEVLWVTGIRANIVGEDRRTPNSPEYFCHSNITMVGPQPVNRKILLGDQFQGTFKLFTLVQGQAEIRFPEGFALPVLSNEALRSQVMVMNPSVTEEPVKIGVKSRIDFVRDSELEQDMKPLYKIALVTKVAVDTPKDDELSHQHEGEESCLEGEEHSVTARSVERPKAPGKFSPLSKNSAGVEQTGHWYVPPGRHVYRYRLPRTKQKIPVDTTAHYIAAHLHPYGESLELVDLTTGKTVYKAISRNYSDRVAVEEITHYSSANGIPIHRDHEYEIIATYNNTTDEDIDSMAVMYLYLLDKQVDLRRGSHGA